MREVEDAVASMQEQRKVISLLRRAQTAQNLEDAQWPAMVREQETIAKRLHREKTAPDLLRQWSGQATRIGQATGMFEELVQETGPEWDEVNGQRTESKTCEMQQSFRQQSADICGKKVVQQSQEQDWIPRREGCSAPHQHQHEWTPEPKSVFELGSVGLATVKLKNALETKRLRMLQPLPSWIAPLDEQTEWHEFWDLSSGRKTFRNAQTQEETFVKPASLARQEEYQERERERQGLDRNRPVASESAWTTNHKSDLLDGNGGKTLVCALM